MRRMSQSSSSTRASPHNHLLPLNRQNWQQLQLYRWKLRHRQIQQLHRKPVTEPGTELRCLDLNCLYALAKLAFWRDCNHAKKPLQTDTDEWGFPWTTCGAGWPPHHLCFSGCPEDGVVRACLDGEAALSQMAVRAAPCGWSQGPSHSCSHPGPVASNVALKLNLLKLFACLPPLSAPFLSPGELRISCICRAGSWHLASLVILVCQMWPWARSVLCCLHRGVDMGMASSRASDSPLYDLMYQTQVFCPRNSLTGLLSSYSLGWEKIEVC